MDRRMMAALIGAAALGGAAPATHAQSMYDYGNVPGAGNGPVQSMGEAQYGDGPEVGVTVESGVGASSPGLVQGSGVLPGYESQPYINSTPGTEPYKQDAPGAERGNIAAPENAPTDGSNGMP